MKFDLLQLIQIFNAIHKYIINIFVKNDWDILDLFKYKCTIMYID